jgi:hypothetical protein
LAAVEPVATEASTAGGSCGRVGDLECLDGVRELSVIRIAHAPGWNSVGLATDMLNPNVWPGEDERLVAIVAADEVWRCPVVAANLEDDRGVL